MERRIRFGPRGRTIGLVSIALAVAAGGFWQVRAGAAGTGVPSEFVAITPCRLFDTRPGGDNVGPRSTPLGPAERAVFSVHGSNGNCAIPTGATAIAANVTATGATAPTFLTVYPSDDTQPTSSNLNPTPGSPATPNQVTVGLSADGQIAVFNLAGSVDVVLDVVGFYQPAASNQGPQGPPGISGYEVVLLPGIMEVGDFTGGFSVNCPEGKKVLGGGVATFNKDIQVTADSPLDNGTTWVVSTRTFSGDAITARSAVNVRVACAFVEEAVP